MLLGCGPQPPPMIFPHKPGLGWLAQEVRGWGPQVSVAIEWGSFLLWTSMHLPIPGEPHRAYSRLEVPRGPYTTLGSSLGCSCAAELAVWQLVFQRK